MLILYLHITSKCHHLCQDELKRKVLHAHGVIEKLVTEHDDNIQIKVM